jgi:hypothetical protein
MSDTIPISALRFLGESNTGPAKSRLRLYAEGDKIMILETGEVFTVLQDLSSEQEPGIAVREEIGRLLGHGEVRPAGHTRQRRDLEESIIAPEAPPPPPDDCVQLDDIAAGNFSEELHPD